MIASLKAPRPIHVAVIAILATAAAMLVAQIEGDRGIAPIASSSDFEVGNVRVDVTGPSAEAARVAGWKQAQRLAWRRLSKGGSLPDGALDTMVSAIEVQNEQIGPQRYIATLTVLFDRARAGQALGVAGEAPRSPPLLVIPVLHDGGISTAYEQTSEWQRAWATFRTADSAIDYVRTSGTGPDALLLNAGQTGRHGRTWWRTLLDLYGAADVVIPVARLERTSPTGPVIGRFSARYGPDDTYIGGFALRVEHAADVPAMMSKAVQRMDALYANALASGELRPDPSLIVEEPISEDLIGNGVDLAGTEPLPADAAGGASIGETRFVIQYETPTSGSVSQVETLMRSIPGVRVATTTSLALGGTSVMQLSFAQGPEELREALAARGFAVQGSGTTLRIVARGAAGQP